MRADKIRDLLVDSYCEDEGVLVELEELERLAKIGKAFELAKEKEFGMFVYTPYAGAKTTFYSITDDEYRRVLEWYEREGDNEGL